ncbi:MAG: hypothetical protein C4288_03790 [Leptolyngbya sp. ERB_1_1]
MHQLGTLAVCQQEITAGYDTLQDALVLRTDLNDQTAIAFSTHNLAQIKALIVPVKSQNSPGFYQRQIYWIVGVICAIFLGVLIGASILHTHHQAPNHEYRPDRSHLD